MRSTFGTVALLIALGLPAAAGAAGAGSPLTAKMTGEGTSQNGAVRITQKGPSSLLIEIQLSSATGSEPADLHHGSCSKIQGRVKKLSPVVNGASSTTLTGLDLATVRKGTYAVLVHASASDLTRYVSCGDVGRGAHLTDTFDEKGFGGKAGQ
jgi:hypothetical protein